MNQSRIDAATKSKIGINDKERGKSRKIMANLMHTCLDEHAAFYEFFKRLFPKIGDFSTKSIEHSESNRDHDCADHVFKAVEYTGQQASKITNFFKANYPKEWAQINQYQHDWLDRLMKNNLPGRGAPFSAAYWDMIQQGATFGYQTVLADKSRPNPTLPPMPFVVDAGEGFVKTIYADGYGLVNSQITLGVITPAMNSINSLLLEGKSWTEITADLHSQFGAKEYHWERLVRTEMAMSANAGTMAQAKELNEPSTVIKWSTTAGSVCPICAPRNGNLYELDAPEVTNLLPHPNCMCARVITFRKRATT